MELVSYILILFLHLRLRLPSGFFASGFLTKLRTHWFSLPCMSHLCFYIVDITIVSSVGIATRIWDG
jgi:hypothetical protein